MFSLYCELVWRVSVLQRRSQYGEMRENDGGLFTLSLMWRSAPLATSRARQFFCLKRDGQWVKMDRVWCDDAG